MNNANITVLNLRTIRLLLRHASIFTSLTHLSHLQFEKMSAVDHPNVLKYMQYGLVGGWRPYMLLEALSGSEVQRVLDKKKWLTEQVSLRPALVYLSSTSFPSLFIRELPWLVCLTCVCVCQEAVGIICGVLKALSGLEA